MSEVCECMAHDSFDTAYIGSDQKMRCQLCKKILPGWDAVTVGSEADEVDVHVAYLGDE